MTFQAEQRIKSQIIDALGTEQLFRLLSDPDPNILMKTLGLLRNLLSSKPVRLRYVQMLKTHVLFTTLSKFQRSLI